MQLVHASRKARPGRRHRVVQRNSHAGGLDEDTPIELLLELLLSGLFDLVVELLFRGLGVARRRRERTHPLLAAFGLLLLGCVAGGIVTWALPTRLLGPPALPGASLVVSPVLNGLLMHYYGIWTSRRGKPASFAATFSGGAVFALGFALVRLLMVADR
jgi:hypothetical protein